MTSEEELYEKILQKLEEDCGCPLDESHARLAVDGIKSMFDNLSPWHPTGWWRSILLNGDLWGESSNEKEIRRDAQDRPGAKVQRHMRRVEEKWEDA